MTTPQHVVIEGLGFPEGPRWYEGALWFSDFYQQTVFRMGSGGDLKPVARVENQPSGLGWLPDCLLYTSPSPRDATLARMPSSA